MKTKHIGFELTIFDSLDEMPEMDVRLLQSAEKARLHSYSPYSKFSVGAALLLENGTILLGSNQENASFPAGLCAERVTLFNAGANYPSERIMAIAVTTIAKGNPAAPCGICRQSISEYENRQKAPIRIVMMGKEGPVYCCNSISDLLPLGFDSSFL